MKIEKGITYVSCPCCGDEMHPDLVVCWECWRLSDKLTPGTHKDNSNIDCYISTEMIEGWTKARADRGDPSRAYGEVTK